MFVLVRLLKIPKLLNTAVDELTAITGQKAQMTKAKKAVANFKLRAGMPLGASVTLRKDRMYTFLEKLIHFTIPRVSDFRGLSPKGFDGRGNYNMGLKEQIVFPEVNYDKVDKVRGMNITICTSSPDRCRRKGLVGSYWVCLLRSHRELMLYGYNWRFPNKSEKCWEWRNMTRWMCPLRIYGWVLPKFSKRRVTLEVIKQPRDGKQGVMRVYLRYDKKGHHVINRNGHRVSRPRKENLCGCYLSVPKVRSGYGLAILSTNKGVVSGEQAIKENVGGEVLCQVW